MRWVGSDGVEFGVGDTVECVVPDSEGRWIRRGVHYTAYGPSVLLGREGLVISGGDLHSPDDGDGWYSNRFKLVPPAPNPVRHTHIPVRTTLPVDSAARKEVPIYSGPFRMFPAALTGLARVCRLGSAKHNPSEPIQHNRAKSKDHADCIARHMIDMSEDFGCGVGRDENGVPQVDYILWRAAALCQWWHEVHDGAPVAPAATNVASAATSVGKDGVR